MPAVHYYKRNIGDYHKKAGRLSILQHGVYMLLIDSCYDRERFPTLNEAIKWVWASTKEEKEAVEFVLSRFFELQESDIYEQKRIKEEVGDYRELCETNRIKGKLGGRPKKTDKEPNKTQKVNPNNPEGSPENPKPLTTNQEPLTTNQEPVVVETAEAFDEYAKSRQANNPAATNGKNLLTLDWQPGSETIAALKQINGVPDAFINEEKLEFIVYWRERGVSADSWNAKFLKSCIRQWRKYGHDWNEHPDPPEQGFIEKHTDDSWREGL